MMFCYFCGRAGTRGFETYLDRKRCTDHEACVKRLHETTPASKLRRIRGLIEAEEYQSGDAGSLARRIRKVLSE